MKIFLKNNIDGFTFIEVITVIAIIATLASIALPYYAVNKEQARAASCLSNRRNIENDETAHFAQHHSPSLSISDTYKCPNDGTYIWLISDPEDSDYPSVGCSIHFAGFPDPPDSPPSTVLEAIQSLLDDLPRLDLGGPWEGEMRKKLNKVIDMYKKDRIDRAKFWLERTQYRIGVKQKEQRSFTDEQRDYLSRRVSDIQRMIP